MSNGLECLRASKAAGDEQTETEARDCGKRWALDEAEYSDLRRVANLKDANRDVNMGELRRAIDHEDALDDDEFNNAVGYDEDNEPVLFVKAFIEGAAEVFYEI
jgi:hypothetical protein